MKAFIFLLLAVTTLCVSTLAQTRLWSLRDKRVLPAAYWKLEPRHWFSEDKLTVSNAIALKVFASDIFDPDQSVLNAGAEFFFADRFGLEVAAGMGLGDKPWLAKMYHYGTHVHKDFRVALEPRIYWNNKNASRYFFALSGWYRRKEMKIDRGNLIGHNSTAGYSFTDGNLDQDIAGVALQLGRQFFIGDHFIIELAIGPGYMTFNNYFNNLKNLGPVKDYEFFTMGGLLTSTVYRNEWEFGAGGVYLPSHIKLGFVIP